MVRCIQNIPAAPLFVGPAVNHNICKLSQQQDGENRYSSVTLQWSEADFGFTCETPTLYYAIYMAISGSTPVYLDVCILKFSFLMFEESIVFHVFLHSFRTYNWGYIYMVSGSNENNFSIELGVLFLKNLDWKYNFFKFSNKVVYLVFCNCSSNSGTVNNHKWYISPAIPMPTYISYQSLQFNLVCV